MPTNKPEVVLPELPVSVARIHSDGYWTTDDRRPDWQWPSRQDVFTADQLRAYGQACIDTLTRPAAGDFVMVPREPTREQEVVAYLTEDEVNGVTRRGLEFANCGTRRPGVSYYPLTHMHPQPAMPGIAWEAFSALEDVQFGEHASAKHFIRPYLQGGDVLGWRMVDGVRVFGIVPASGLLPRQDFVRYDDFLSATSTQPQQPAEAVAVDFGPIERAEALDRTYIPMPGGWEIHTKGKGSTFRICDPQGERLPIPESPYLHETLERMAREVHAAARAATPPPAIDIGKLRELVEVLNHAIATQLGARVTIHATRARQIRDELAALIGDGGERANG